MNFDVIDYSEMLYKENITPTRQGKFLQIVDDGEIELLVLSPYELSKFHAQILERYCMLQDIEGRYVKKPDHFRATGADIEVIGGGHWKIDESVLRLVLNGESTVYGRFNSEGLSGKVRKLPKYSAYTVVVGG